MKQKYPRTSSRVVAVDQDSIDSFSFSESMPLHGMWFLHWLSNVPLNTALLLAVVGMVGFIVLIEITWMLYLASRTWAMYCAGRRAQAQKLEEQPTERPDAPEPLSPLSPLTPKEPAYPLGAITARDVLGEEEWAKICRKRVQSMDAMMRQMNERREQCAKETDEKKHDLDSSFRYITTRSHRWSLGFSQSRRCGHRCWCPRRRGPPTWLCPGSSRSPRRSAETGRWCRTPP